MPLAAAVDPATTTGSVQLLDWAVRLLLALGGLTGVGALVSVRAQKRKLVADTGKTDAEADNIMADASVKRVDYADKVIGVYERGIDHMQEQLDEANAKIDRLTDYIEVLVAALRAGGLPVPAMPRRLDSPGPPTGPMPVPADR